ncbi:MAG: redoxin domain-containing protein [Verrucomicrobiae bacterium]|nr:redoxin domain-containing protein [Verrucomicrobiae bacterium]
MWRPTLLTILVIILGLPAGSLHAQKVLGEGIFHRFDRDGDGTVTEAELPDAATRARYDRNGDGSVTLAEFRETVRGEKPATDSSETEEKRDDGSDRLDAFVAALDTDKDGKLSREESRGGGWFDRVDRNRDDLIDAAELDAVRALVKRLGSGILPEVPEHPITESEIAEITSGPEILKPEDVGVGRMIPDITFTTIDGETHSLAEAKDHRGVVIAMTSATCPVSKRFLPALAELEPKLAAQGIPLVLVNPFASETLDEIRPQIAEHGLKAPYVHDTDKAFATALGATTTTEVFFLDSKRTLLYRGALSDQYGINYSVEKPRHEYLVDAIEAHLKNERPLISATAAPGCELDLKTEDASLTQTDVTYHRDVARILQQNCVGCHHEGGIAPFALDDFVEVDDRAKVIKRVVTEGTMPPWFAAPQADGGPSPWANDHSLSARDRADLLAWLESSDRPMGDPADAPEPLTFSTEWTIGEPDLVVPISHAYDIKADGFMPYQYDTVKLELTEDRWVGAWEIRPSEYDVVHHVIVQVFKSGDKVTRRGEAEAGYWAAYVPGNGSHVYPEGFAKKLPAGATVQFQIHYTPSGVAKKERLKMGLKFVENPPRYEVKTLPLADRKLEIPPGAPNHEEGMSRKAPVDIPVIGFMPHMHTRGKAFRYEVTYPDGEHEILLDIPRYDFNWQLRYELKEPKLIPRGSTVKVTGVFDNSTGNQANPDPTKTVRWGDQTVDEMLIGYMEYFVPVEEGKVASKD